jgi:hypothetical protein
MANKPKPLIQFAACEGFYASVIYFIALLGGLGVLLFLSDSWTRGITSLVVYVLLILAFIRYAETKRRSGDGFIVSFSRTNTTVVCDIFIQTVRVSVVSVLVDLIGNQKLGLLFNDKDPGWYQARLTIAVIILLFMLLFPMVYGYLTQVSAELENQRSSTPKTG